MNTTRQGAAVNARGIGVEGPRGWAFQGIDITAEPGALIAVQGSSGSGRTCLLLALTGRMRITAGEATVAGLPLPKRMGTVRSRTAIAHVPGVVELEPALTVGEHLKEQALLGHRFQGLSASLPWGKRQKEATRARIDAALAAVRLDPGTLVKGLGTAVRDLERIEALRLSVALGIMHGPQLLAVDDVDLKLSAEERAEAWQMLRDLAQAGTTIVAAGSEAPADALVVRTTPAPATAAKTEAAPADTETDAAPEAEADAPADDAGTAGGTHTDETDKEEAAHAFAETGRA
ncbi:ABC transporter family protein [Streptomyces sp. 2333.5]|uniref:ATP-binding cassette domain-containing protein n=1 Tax=unclassified Streptomyces TaxID=2593676 RepID=UPI00089C4F04|nr:MULTISPECIES: ATP-binding cassette domain-containing protein [unclassified Streptomyces]PJJ02091.1 ABC transporter family protein [Streptomyces sp. 2333.5]SEC95017.1 ABC transporter [Streptomyces sp. 2314.4]SED80914.1 ABC transporter [Streptomyces sp. 2112.2]